MQQPTTDIIESLLEKPCWVIDFLPRQVPADQGTQFFKIEKLLLQSPHINLLYDKFAAILLQLYCYYDIHLCMNDDDEWTFNPEPEHLLNAVHSVLEQKRHLVILIEATSTLLTLSGDDTHITVYNPSDDILPLLDKLATAQGLFLWKPQ